MGVLVRLKEQGKIVVEVPVATIASPADALELSHGVDRLEGKGRGKMWGSGHVAEDEVIVAEGG